MARTWAPIHNAAKVITCGPSRTTFEAARCRGRKKDGYCGQWKQIQGRLPAIRVGRAVGQDTFVLHGDEVVEPSAVFQFDR